MITFFQCYHRDLQATHTYLPLSDTGSVTQFFIPCNSLHLSDTCPSVLLCKDRYRNPFLGYFQNTYHFFCYCFLNYRHTSLTRNNMQSFRRPRPAFGDAHAVSPLLTWPARISTPVTDISLTSHDLADRKDNMICKQVTTRDNRYITQIMCFDKATISRQVSIEGVEELGKTQIKISLSVCQRDWRGALTLWERDLEQKEKRLTLWGWMPELIGLRGELLFSDQKKKTHGDWFLWVGGAFNATKKTVLVDLLTEEINLTSLHCLHALHLLSIFQIP